MNLLTNRRTLISAALLAAASPSQAAFFQDWLSHQDNAEKIFLILQEHLNLKNDQRDLMPAFITRLKTTGLHTESPEELQKYLQDPSRSEELAAYIVEEFVVASNYFAVQAGEENQLRILQVPA